MEVATTAREERNSDSHGSLWDQTIAEKWHRFRMGTALATMLAGVVLGALWGWAGGWATALLSLIPMADAAASLRRGARDPLRSMAIDVTAIGIAMVAVQLQPVALGGPLMYVALISILFLRRHQAVLVLAYALGWSALTLVGWELVAVPESATPQVVTMIVYAIFVTQTVAVLVVMSYALRGLASAREDALARLEMAASSKSQFLASVSHEVRTPLTSVVGFASLLKEQQLPPEVAEMVEIVSRQAHEVEYIVEDLLVAARAEVDAIVLLEEPTDVCSSVLTVVANLHEGTPALSASATGVMARADAARFRQIIRVLLTNAFRYGGPNVAVDVSDLGPMVRVSVVDDGPGVPPQDVDHIFGLYHRAHEAVGQPQAIGLGLYVARHLARLMGGDIAHRREDGKTSFELTVPKWDVDDRACDVPREVIVPALVAQSAYTA